MKIAMSMKNKEITHLVMQIHKLHSDGMYEDISGLLADLHNSQITLEQLQATDIGKTVYQLIKSCPVISIRKKAKGLLLKWKRQHSSPNEHKNIKEIRQTREHEPNESVPSTTLHLNPKENNTDSVVCYKAEHSNANQEPKHQSSEEAAASIEETSSTKFSAPKAIPTAEFSQPTLSASPQPSSSTHCTTLRAKCVELLQQALNSDQRTDPEQTDLLQSLAQAIEMHIHALHGHNPPKYKSCIRSRIANLKNPKSPHLRQGLLTNTLTPKVFASMDAEEMAGEELRQLRQGYTVAGISERQLPQGPEGTPTTKVRCQRCEGTDCRVTHISRGTLFLPSWVKRGSTDEDAMTFITCATCGAQWYHNRWVCL